MAHDDSASSALRTPPLVFLLFAILSIEPESQDKNHVNVGLELVVSSGPGKEIETLSLVDSV